MKTSLSDDGGAQDGSSPSTPRWLTIALWGGLFAATLRLFHVASASIAANGAPSGYVTEDAFLSLQIAWNVAHGHGVTVSGEITSGFQPLWVFLLALVDRVSAADLPSFARSALLLCATCAVGASAVIARIVRESYPAHAHGDAIFPFTALLFLANPGLERQALNGLETSLSLLLLSLLVLASKRAREERTAASAARLGAVLGLAVLARNDTFLLTPLLVSSMLRSRTAKHLSTPTRAQSALTMLGVTLLLVAPWLAWNYHVMDTLQPQSGLSQSWLYGSNVPTPEIWARMAGAAPRAFFTALLWTGLSVFSPALALTHTGAPFSQQFDFSGGWLRLPLMVLLGSTGLVWLARRMLDLRGKLVARPGFLLWLWPFLMFACLLPFTYVPYVSLEWSYERYFAPFYVVAGIATPLAIASICDGLQKLAPRAPLWLPRLLTLAVSIVTMPLNPALVTHHTDAANHFREQLWLKSIVEEGSRVCSFQSGVHGYYALRSPWVSINTDGKVNRIALRHRKAGRMRDFFAAHCDYVFDWKVHISRKRKAWDGLCVEHATFEDKLYAHHATLQGGPVEHESVLLRCKPNGRGSRAIGFNSTLRQRRAQ